MAFFHGLKKSTLRFWCGSVELVDQNELRKNRARQVIEEGHEYPNVGDLCRIMDISISTFHNHLAADGKFAKDWHELELKGEATCLSDMYALRKKNPMYMFGWLRARFPGKYDPTRRVEVSSDFSWLKEAITKEKPQVIATEAEIISTPKATDAL